MMKALLFLSLALLSTHYAYSMERNSVAVDINNEVITIFDIRSEIFFDRVENGVEWNRAVTERDIKSFLPILIDKWLVAQEAVKFSVVEITPATIKEEFAIFKNRFKTPQDFDRFKDVSQMSVNDIERVLTRELQRQEFLKIKAPSLQLDPSNADIDNYYWQYAYKFKGQKLEDVKAEIVDVLKKSMYEKAMRKWLVDLRSRSNITYVIR